MKVLMANDLSARSDRAFRRAVALAKELDAELEVLTVIQEMFLEATTRSNLALAEKALEEQVAAVPDMDGLPITKSAVVGVDYEKILQTAEERDAGLVVLGIHRHKRRELFQGTTAERLVRYSPRPLLVVKDPVKGPYRRIVVASDLSAQAQAAMRMAAGLAPKGEMVVVHVVNAPFQAFLGQRDQTALLEERRATASRALDEQIEKIGHELGDRVPKIEQRFPTGDVYGAIQREVASLKPDLLAVGTHGRSGVSHAIIGSVTENLLAECPIDVLVVH